MTSSTMTSGTRNPSVIHNIQALRGMAVLSVLLFHCVGIERKYAGDRLLGDVLQIGAAGVDLFFLISGFIMMHLAGNKAAGFTSALSFLRARATRIYPLYWLVTLLLYAAWRLQPDIMQNTPDQALFLLKSLLLLPQEPLPLLSVGWTLIHEMYFYAVFSLLLLLPVASRSPLLLLWALASLASSVILTPPQSQPVLYLLANPLTLEFCAGCALALFATRWRIQYPALLLAIGIASAGIAWLVWQRGNTLEFPVGGERVLCFLLPSALVLLGALTMEQQGKWLPAWLQGIGDASYSIYLIHILVLSLVGKLWQPLADEHSLIDNLLWLPGMFFTAIIAGLLCHRLVEKPLLRLLHRKG